MSKTGSASRSGLRTILGFLMGLLTAALLVWGAHSFWDHFPQPQIKREFRTDEQDSEEKLSLRGWNPNQPLWAKPGKEYPSIGNANGPKLHSADQPSDHTGTSAAEDLAGWPNDTPEGEGQSAKELQGLVLLEAGDFPGADQARQKAQELQGIGIAARVISKGVGGFRLRMGPFEDQEELTQTRRTLKTMGLSPQTRPL